MRKACVSLSWKRINMCSRAHMQRRLCACENDTCDLFNVTATIRSLQTSKEDLQILSEAISIRTRAAPDANNNDTVARCEGSDDRVGNSMSTASFVPPLLAARVDS